MRTEIDVESLRVGLAKAKTTEKFGVDRRSTRSKAIAEVLPELRALRDSKATYRQIVEVLKQFDVVLSEATLRQTMRREGAVKSRRRRDEKANDSMNGRRQNGETRDIATHASLSSSAPVHAATRRAGREP